MMNKIVIEALSENQIAEREIQQWPIWEKEISCFDWEYDSEEECYILEGNVVVETEEGTAHIKPGDFVTFKKGLKCKWDIKSPIKKHYNFK